MAWLSGWDYRISHNMAGATGAGTDYQIPITVHSGSIASSAITVGTSTTQYGWGFDYPEQRKMFEMAGLLWIFYSDGTNGVYKTSDDKGLTWSSATTWKAGVLGAAHFALTFDGTYIHYVYNGRGNGEDTKYRRGTPETDGTITWSAVEQTATAIDAGRYVFNPNIAVDSNGCPWIGYGNLPTTYPTGDCYGYVTKSSASDGTWATDTGFPYLIRDTLDTNYAVVIDGVALTSGKMYWFYGGVSAPYTSHGKLYNSGWGSEEDIDSDHTYVSSKDMVVEGDDIHLVQVDGNQDTYYTKRTYGAGWGDVQLVVAQTAATVSTPSLTLTGTNSVAVIYCDMTTYHIWYREMLLGVWQDAVDWITSSTIPHLADFGTMASATNKIHFAWMTGSGSPFTLNYAVYPAVNPGGNTVYLDDKCTNFPTDIAFTDNNGSSELYHWSEDLTTDPVVYWVKVTDTLEGAVTVPIYVYCGKSGGSSAYYSGANTFIVFDDFERDSNGSPIGGSWTILTGDIDISTDHAYGGTRCGKWIGAVSGPAATIPVTAGDAIAIRYQTWKETAVKNQAIAHGNGTYILYSDTGATALEDIRYYNDSSGYVDTGANLAPDEWELMEFRNFVWATPTVDIVQNDVVVTDNANISYAGSGGANILRVAIVDDAAGRDSYFDNFIVRKWVATEPTHGAWGEWETEGEILEASATLSGAGTLAAIGQRIVNSIAAVSGTGLLASLSSLTGIGQSNFAGAGSLTASASVGNTLEGASSLSAAGSLNIATQLTYSALVSISGEGTLVVSASVGNLEQAEASLSGQGTLAISGTVILAATVSISGTGTLVIVAAGVRQAASGLTATGTLSCTCQVIVGASGALAGTGILTASGEVGAEITGSCSIIGQGSLIIQSSLTAVSSLDITGEGTLTLSSIITRTAQASLQGIGILTTSGSVGNLEEAVASLLGEGTLSIIATVTTPASVQLSASGMILAAGVITASGLLSVEGIGSIIVSGLRTIQGTTSLSGIGSLTISSIRFAQGAASISGVGNLISEAIKTLLVASSLSGIGTLSASGSVGAEVEGASSLIGEGTLVSNGVLIISDSTSISGIGTIIVSGSIGQLEEAAAVLIGIGTVIVNGSLTLVGAVSSQGTGTLTVLSYVIRTGTVSIQGDGQLSVSAELIRTASLGLTGEGILALIAQAIRVVNASLSGIGTLTASGAIGELEEAAASLSGIGTLTSIGVVTLAADVSISGLGTVTVSASIGNLEEGEASLSGEGLLSAVCSITRQAIITLAGQGTLQTAGIRLRTASLSIAGAGTLVVSASVGHLEEAAASISGVGTLAITVLLLRQGQVALTGIGTLSTQSMLTLAVMSSILGEGFLVAEGTTALLRKQYLTAMLASRILNAKVPARTLNVKVRQYE